MSEETRYEEATPLGPVWLFGRDRGQPALVIVSGAFASSDYLEATWRHLPGVDVLRTHLPGNHCPQLATVTVAAYAAALSHALAQRLGERPLVVTGVSVGALVALGVKAQGLRRLVLVEPPLQPVRAWPLRRLRDQAPPGVETFLRNVLGVGADCAAAAPDYRPLLQGLRVPALVLLGDDPLDPPRPFGQTPSLVDEESRALLNAHPLVEVKVAPGVGHNVPLAAAPLLLDAMRRACRAAFGSPP